MIILSIDTSCDDTCVSIVKVKNQKSKVGDIKFAILANIVSSQVRLHRRYGGVYPALAKREHQKNLPLVLKKAFKKAELSEKELDFLSVTVGPGLEPCLWVGVNFAKDLAVRSGLKIVPVNHLEAHIMANWLKPIRQCQMSNVKCQIFPAVCLVVSGGHTQLILMGKIGDYKIIGETRDDAAGECFDKTARILGLSYPGGPAIAAAAVKSKNRKLKVNLPRPMLYYKNYDFSFSGLKTAVLYDFKKREPKVRKSKQYIRETAIEIQQAIVDVLIAKTLRAAREHGAKAVMLGGGVTANDALRKQFEKACSKFGIKLFTPARGFCTDNAAMVASAGYFSWLRGKAVDWQSIEAKANLRIIE